MQDELQERVHRILADPAIQPLMVQALEQIAIESGIQINIVDLVKTICSLPFKYGAFKGGGVKGIAYVGVIKVLQQFGLLDKIDSLIGASAGGLTAAFLGLGVTPEQIDEILSSFTAEEIHDGNSTSSKIANLVVRRRGWDTGEGLTSWFKEQLDKLGIDPNITFAEHQRLVDAGVLNKKEIILIGSDTTRGKRFIFSAKTTPDMKIADAVRISTGIPGYFNATYVELDDDGNIRFETDAQGVKHLVCSYDKDPNNPRQICLVDGGLIDNIGNDLKNFMGIQNSRMAVFYLLKWDDISQEDKDRLVQEKQQRCEQFLQANSKQVLSKTDRLKSKLSSAVTKTSFLFKGTVEEKEQHRLQREAQKQSAHQARDNEQIIKKEQQQLQRLDSRHILSNPLKKVGLLRSFKQQISQMLGAIRKGQERNLEQGVAFIDPVPDLSTKDFDKAQIQPVKEMAINNGVRSTLSMLIAEALPLLLHHQRKSAEPANEPAIQAYPRSVHSTHAEVLRLGYAKLKSFMQNHAQTIYYQEGQLQIVCPLAKLAKLEKCASDYYHYGHTQKITVHVNGDHAILTVGISSNLLKQKHEKWLNSPQLIDRKTHHMHLAEEGEVRLDFHHTEDDNSAIVDEAFSTLLLRSLKP